MGGITLDPASSPLANRSVKADKIISLDLGFAESGNLNRVTGGIQQAWSGNVWMNHPFARTENPCTTNCTKKVCKKRGFHTDIRIDGNKEWIEKLVSEYRAGNIEQACCITFSSTSEAWFKPLLDFKQCFIYGRINYYLPDGSVKKGVTKGSVVTYLGENTGKFEDVFGKIGKVK